MFEFVKLWYERKFSDPHSVTLFFVSIAIVALLYFVGSLIIPVLVAVVIAFLLEWPVQKMTQIGSSRLTASALVMLCFSSLAIASFIGIVPVLWQQLANFLQEAPHMLEKGKAYLLQLPAQYPELITSMQIQTLVGAVENKFIEFGQIILSSSLTSLKDIVALLIYLILVPLLVFFMLKDKKELVGGVSRLLPEQRRLLSQVWREMHQQIMNYIRGKVIEILIVGGVSFITFALFDLRYAALLGALVGFSVLIPFVGAALVTIPVAAVALFQFGLAPEFWYIIIAYGIIQALDGNVLVPVLFSEAVDLNPVYIIVAVLFFGGLWGFWGVFFAIPLASLVRALINAWSSEQEKVAVE
ncbi:AI-2E family transporter [Pseudoalteromonas tunicata]|uniref:Putative permease (PerM family) protein n=1 Tax=Pseudoalteromonas tunicata D2 TaxID=87626 RepID=A4CBC0_9GAMM|nr:AI-2E family transporter [Pseudoalteromonas tunicata]ATC94212.1 putative permease [Pseudoalteromonas tunicata]AXT29971.1 AI-2E family transporter [Pseudoalteromonas tunicata]EAR27657.1 putative permease (PerM family) protein [Pseudoalteromonas tunicata D2]MDP4983032.1 AI-2E family transporter [Pseudoalteromonas tunicata]MDP5211440.1 AI-2E family transporter [Pseudoalteromonas tunicata]